LKLSERVVNLGGYRADGSGRKSRDGDGGNRAHLDLRRALRVKRLLAAFAMRDARATPFDARPRSPATTPPMQGKIASFVSLSPAARTARSRASSLASSARSVTLVLAMALSLPLLTRCEPWEEGPPPANANAAQPGGDPAAIPPPGPPIPPAGGAAAEAAAPPDDEGRYASGEYTIGADSDSYADDDPSALTDFRAPLEPYGTWSDDATYGTVWSPAPSAVGADFTPYVSAGHWAYDDDYVWVSDYSWGWAPFHYGRWVFVDGRGWSWIPGREYRGAWVNWEVDDGYSYLGWAPMGPAFVWFGGAPVIYRGYWGPRWSYVPRGDVFAPRVGARVVVGPSAIAIGGRMRPYTVSEGRLGPPPARFGYRGDQVPRVTAGASIGVAHAQQFARPSTARPLGASAPSRGEARVEARPGVAPQTRGPLVEGPRPAYSARPTYNVPRPDSNVPRSVGPTVTSVPRTVTPGGAPAVGRVQATPAPVRAAPMPAPRPAGAVHVGGGPHR
jgi:hypothetical protein